MLSVSATRASRRQASRNVAPKEYPRMRRVATSFGKRNRRQAAADGSRGSDAAPCPPRLGPRPRRIGRATPKLRCRGQALHQGGKLERSCRLIILILVEEGRHGLYVSSSCLHP